MERIDTIIKKKRRKSFAILKVWRLIQNRGDRNFYIFFYLFIFGSGSFIAYKIFPFKDSKVLISESNVVPYSLKYLITFPSTVLKYFVILTLILVFIISIFRTFELISNRKELKMLMLRPVSLVDVVIAKLIMSFEENFKLVSLFALPFFLVYYIESNLALKHLIRFKTFIFSNIGYIILVPLYFALITFISISLFFAIGLSLRTLFRKSTTKIHIKNTLNQISILLLVLSMLYTTLFYTTNTLKDSIYGPIPIYFVTKAIISIMRPKPNFYYSILLLFALLGISALSFLLPIFVARATSDLILNLPEFEENKATSFIKNRSKKIIKILNILPYLIKHDLLIFFRKGESFRLYMSQLMSQIFLYLLLIFTQSMSFKGSSFLNLSAFGVTYRYLTNQLIFLLIISLSFGFEFQLKTEGKSIFLIKLSSLDLKHFVLMKFLSAMIIELGIFVPILVIIILFFTYSNSISYRIIAILQYLVIFIWLSMMNFYYGARNYNLDYINGNVEIGQRRFIQTIPSLILWGICFFVYKFIYSQNIIIGLLITLSELILPFAFLKRIVNFASERIENLSLEN